MAIETLGAALRQINRLFSGGTVAGFSDAQLLERFVSGRDDAAFEALVARHGPMVLSVCRGVLHDPNDAEDAFQATFLVLVKKAGTFRGRVALGGWLYLVAQRVAIRANVAASRRRAYERQAGQMAAAKSVSGPAVRDERLRALHEEIARLPEKLRLAILLCDLQGVPQDQAAGQLRLSGRTLRRRLSEGRERLKARLDRRGPASDGATLAALLLREAGTVVPPAWRETAVRAALAYSESMVATGVVSAAAATLSYEVLKTMMLQKLKLASAALLGAGFLTWGASAALVPRGDGPPATREAEAPRPTPALSPAPAPEDDVTGTLDVRGRVLDPDGKPIDRAEVYVLHRADTDHRKVKADSPDQPGRVTASDSDGRFRFPLDKAASDWPYSEGPAWREARVAAVAPGFGPAWVEAGAIAEKGEVTLRLVRDDIPIRGRVLDAQGRPVAGVAVKVTQIGAPNQSVDLDAMLASGEYKYSNFDAWYGVPAWLGREGRTTTGADGRFEISGVGRDRTAGIDIESPVLEKVFLYAMARRSEAKPKPRPRPSLPPGEMRLIGRPPAPRLAGSTFDVVAGPTKPIVGVVRLKGTGKPVAGVRVSGAEGATWTHVGDTTDAEGRFRLVGLPKAGSYEVRASPRPGDPYLGAVATVTDTEGLKPIEVTLELPPGVPVTGRLVDKATGKSVRAMHVSHISLPNNRHEGHAQLGRISPTDKTFLITVPPGEGMIYANVPGLDTPFIRARLKKEDKGKGVGGLGDNETSTIPLNGYHAYKFIDVPADVGSFSIELELTHGVTLKGKLIDPDGRPVVGARSYGLGARWGRAQTLNTDTFEVVGLEPGHPRRVFFAHQGRKLVGSIVVKDEDLKAATPLEVRLVPAGSIVGRLVDDDGLPLAGTTISVVNFDLAGANLPYGENDALWPGNETFTADAEGRFRVEGFVPGVESVIGIESPTRPNFRLDAGKALQKLTTGPGEVRDLGDVKVKVQPVE